MDKSNHNRTITIKINGTERSYQEETIKIDKSIESKLVEQVTETIEQESLPEISEIVASQEVAASQQPAEDSFDWILPEETSDDIVEYKIAKKHSNKTKLIQKTLKKQRIVPIKSIISSVLLAIVIGTTFGLLVLKLVISDTTPKDLPVSTVPIETNQDPKNTATNGGKLQLEPLDTYIVQGGVFSSIESAQLIEQAAKSKGVATGIVVDKNQAILILGVADSLNNAKEIAAIIGDKDLEVFAKTYALPSKNLQSLTSGETEFLKEIHSLYQSVSMLTTGVMMMGVLDESELGKQKQKIQSLSEGEFTNKNIDKLRAELLNSVVKLEAYSQNPTELQIKEAQEHLLTFIGTYFTL